MKNHKGNGNWGKAVPIISIAVCATAFFLIGQPLSHQDLAEWLPQNRTLAVLATMLMYAVKSLTIFFPLVSLYLLCGILFPLPEAILLNLLGLAVSTTVPYWMGRLLGSRLLDQLRKKFSKLELLETLRRKSGFQFAVLTRSAGVLPGDVVSLYFGCVRLHYPVYLAGSLLGLAPGMVAATILGNQVSDIGSPGFWAASGCAFAVALCSSLACRRAVRSSGAAAHEPSAKEHVPPAG